MDAMELYPPSEIDKKGLKNHKRRHRFWVVFSVGVFLLGVIGQIGSVILLGWTFVSPDGLMSNGSGRLIYLILAMFSMVLMVVSFVFMRVGRSSLSTSRKKIERAEHMLVELVDLQSKQAGGLSLSSESSSMVTDGKLSLSHRPGELEVVDDAV